jgi:anti-sigma regulatory factor (Ser/Thr protein kinase)
VNPTSGESRDAQRAGDGARVPADERRRFEPGGLPRPAARAKEFTRRALADWSCSAGAPGVDGDVAEDVVLVVAELVANALVHAGGPLSVVLDASTTRLRIEVGDGTPQLPAPRRPHDPSLPGGHGLLIVERATDRWGVVRQGAGKTVWAEIDFCRLAPGREPA